MPVQKKHSEIFLTPEAFRIEKDREPKFDSELLHTPIATS